MESLLNLFYIRKTANKNFSILEIFQLKELKKSKLLKMAIIISILI